MYIIPTYYYTYNYYIYLQYTWKYIENKSNMKFEYGTINFVKILNLGFLVLILKIGFKWLTLGF